MKKTLLTERFQQLAGIKPLYPTRNQINEGIIDDLTSKVKDFGVNSMEKIKSIVGSTITPLANSNEDEVEAIIDDNPELTQELGELEELKRNLEIYLRDYEVGVDTDLNEARGDIAGLASKISAGFGAISGGMLAATGLFGLGKEEASMLESGWNSVVNTVGKGLDYFDFSSGAIDQIPDVTWLYGSPAQFAMATAALLAITLLLKKVKDSQTNENVGRTDLNTIIYRTLDNI